MDRNKLIQKIYKFISTKLNTCIILLYLAAVLLCLFISSTPSEQNAFLAAEVVDDSDNWYYNLKDGRYNIATYTETAEPEKHTIYQITTTVPAKLHKNYAIMFTAKNCRVTVYAGGDPVYQTFSVFSEEADVSYLGKKVHIVGIPNTIVGRTIDIYFQPVTNHDAALIDTVYAGDEELLIKTYVKKNIFPLLISIINILLSLIIFVIGTLNHKTRDGQTKLYFGMFAFCFGVFSITHINIFTLFGDCSEFLYELEFLTLALLPYPALCYIMSSHGILPTLRHNIIKGIPLLNFLFVLICHLTGLLTVNETRPATLVMIVYFAVVILYYMIKAQFQKNHGSFKDNWIDYVYFVFLFSCVTEFVLFHLGLISSFLIISHYILLILLVFMLIVYSRKTHRLVVIGTNAQHLEDAAFYDALTGLRNRASLNQDIEDLEHTLDQNSALAIIQLDINYLKRTNDILGHIAGDRLLKNAAAAIRAGFEDYGKCYRMGGDEFIVILENNPKEKYNLGILAMENACDKINKSLPQMEHVSIAYGIAYYEPNSDTSLWRVQERADVIMYERKRTMKEKNASNRKYQDERL